MLYVDDETSRLEGVILGIADDIGEIRPNNPKIAEHIRNGTTPTQGSIIREVEGFKQVLEDNGVKVYRPENIDGVLQVFTRDIGFVIDNRFVRARMQHQSTESEYKAITHLLKGYDILEPPEGVLIEGGDIVLAPGKVFVGIGKRTNQAGYEFIRDSFRNRSVYPMMPYVSDDPQKNVLHLDYVFQPVGEEHMLVYAEGFKRSPDHIFRHFKPIFLTLDEKYHLASNVLSLSPEKVVSAKGFTRVNDELRKIGLDVIELPYAEVAKFNGLFRCSTLPLYRKP
ncbi:MAG: amidinotransferase [Nanoarchaeota archaeon]|nr:amidinotransferase [Nanoarchaeota archaeon]